MTIFLVLACLPPVVFSTWGYPVCHRGRRSNKSIMPWICCRTMLSSSFPYILSSVLLHFTFVLHPDGGNGPKQCFNYRKIEFSIFWTSISAVKMSKLTTKNSSVLYWIGERQIYHGLNLLIVDQCVNSSSVLTRVILFLRGEVDLFICTSTCMGY